MTQQSVSPSSQPVLPPRGTRQNLDADAFYERESPRAQWTAAASSSTTRIVPMSMPTSAVIAQSIFALLNVPAVPDGYGCSSSSSRLRRGR
jgi:hypothetical protein